MKYEIFKTDDYLLVIDDSEIKEGDYTLHPNGSFGKIEIALAIALFKETNESSYVEDCKKIIAHLPLNNSPILEGVDLLPPLQSEEDDVEKIIYDSDFRGDTKSFTSGYNKAKETYKFTEKQIDIAIDWAIKKGREGDVTITDIDNLIQSLSQPKYPIAFECEMEEYARPMPNIHSKYYLPKTTTNSQGQLILLGKYIY